MNSGQTFIVVKVLHSFVEEDIREFCDASKNGELFVGGGGAQLDDDRRKIFILHFSVLIFHKSLVESSVYSIRSCTLREALKSQNIYTATMECSPYARRG